MRIFVDRLKQIKPRAPEELGPLRIVPITGLSNTRPEYRLLEGDTVEAVQITETGEDGDARRLWRNCTAQQLRDERLIKELRIGPQVSRMIVLGLLENGRVRGDGDVKADVHVRRVLGRAIRGDKYAPDETDEVHRQIRLIKPRKPWQLDLPLYTIGKRVCRKTDPLCDECKLLPVCSFSGC